MQRLDALGEIPEHLIGVYDIVQLRLFQVVVKDDDPGPLLRNVLKLLSGCFFSLRVHAFHPSRTYSIPHLEPKEVFFYSHTTSNVHTQSAEPGGYLQWAEYDATSQTTIKASPTLSSSALDAVPAYVQEFKNKDKHGRVGVQKYAHGSLH